MHLGEGDKEQLFVGEVNGWKSWFSAVLRRPVFVRVKRRLQPTTVGYVLTQCLTTSKLYNHVFNELSQLLAAKIRSVMISCF